MALHVARFKEHGPRVWLGGPYSGAQTNLSLQAAPGARKAVAIDQVWCSGPAGAYTLLDGSGGAVIWRADFAGASYAQFDLDWPLCTSENVGLFLTTTGASAQEVLVLAHIESW